MRTDAPARYLAPFKPYPWQVEAWRDLSPVMLLTGSAGGGKSRLAAEKIHALCKRYPNTTALVLRKTKESLTNSVLIFLERVIVGDDRYCRHYRTRRRFEYSNGSILAYGGMKNEEQREQIRSIGAEGTVDFVWMEEAHEFYEDDFNEVLARMRGRAAPWTQVILSTNPDADTHWIYQRLILDGQASVHESTAFDNPANPESYFNMLNMLTGVLRDRLRDGMWKSAKGAVYANFDARVHLLDAPPAPDAVAAAFVGVDWGYTNPGSMSLWLVDGDGRMYLARQYYATRRLIDWWADRAVELDQWSADNGYGNVVTFVCDPAEPEHIEQLRQRGLVAVGANNAVVPGIQKVQARLAVQPDGRPRLFLVRWALVEPDPLLVKKKHPTCTREEFGIYSWAPAREGRAEKEKPLDVYNHGLDDMRYVAMHLDAPQDGKTAPVDGQVFVGARVKREADERSLKL